MKMGEQNINLQNGLWRHDRDAGTREQARKKKDKVSSSFSSFEECVLLVP